jgi:hypothetical protein
MIVSADLGILAHLPLGISPNHRCDLDVVILPHEKANPPTTISIHRHIFSNGLLLSTESRRGEETGASRAHGTSRRTF